MDIGVEQEIPTVTEQPPIQDKEDDSNSNTATLYDDQLPRVEKEAVISTKRVSIRSCPTCLKNSAQKKRKDHSISRDRLKNVKMHRGSYCRH